MKKLFSFSLVLFLFFQLTGQTNFYWNFGTAAPGSATPSGSLTNLTVGDISIGNSNGTVATWLGSSTASSGYTGSSGSYNAGNAARTGAINTGASGSAYFEFTLTPATGYSVSFSAISFGTRSTSTGPQAYALRSSLDGYVGDIATGTITNNSTWALKSNTSISFSGTSGTAITFRIYGYSGTGTPSSGTINWKIDDLTIAVDVSGGSGGTPPTLTADATNNNVDNNIDITFTDDATWRAAVTGVTVNGSSLTASDYTLSAGNLQLIPSAGNSLLTVSGSKNVAVAATGYSAASVSQTIDFGAAAKLVMKTQPVGPTANGGTLATQPAVNVADQYGNTVASSTATIDAAAGTSPVWTIGGTTSISAVAGTATYTDITGTGSGVVGATIVFSSTGLTSVTSAGFNMPCEAATLPYVEDFSYTSGSLLTNNCWVAHSGTGSNNLTVASASPISYAGYPSGGSNYVAMANTGQDVNKAFTSQNSGSVYVGFLANASAVLTGDYFAHFCVTSGSSAATFIGRIFAKTDGAGAIKFGVSKTSSTTVNYSTSSYALNTTHLIVLKYTFSTGTTTDDNVELFIDPTISSTEPAATLTFTDNTSTDATALTGFCLRQGTASSAPTLGIDGIRLATSWADIMGVTANTPVIQATPSSLAGFSTSAGTVSAIQTCQVSGDYLQEDVLVTAPTNYEVSTDSINFFPTVTLTQTGGNLAGEPVKVFVRIASSSAEGTVSGNLVLSSLNALPANIALSGFVYKPEPTNHALNLQAVSNVWSSINVTWNDNAGTIPADGFLLVMNNIGTFTLPTDGVPVTNDLVVNDGNGAVNVASGVQSYTWNGLSSSTHYYFAIYPYTNSGTYINYKTNLVIPATDVVTAVFIPPTAAWTFDSTTNGTGTPVLYAANYGDQTNTATIYADGTNGSSVWTPGTELDAFTGTVINDPKETTFAGSSMALIGGTALSANGKSIIFKFSMTNLIDPIITFATRGTSTGFNTHSWEWSTDNITYTAFGTNTANTTTTFASRTLDMSTINQVDQAATVYLKLTVSGASNATGNNRIDNFVIRATTQLQNKTLNLKAFIEGLYNVATGEMNPTNDDTFAPKWGATIADTVTIKLHDATTFNEIEKFSGINWNTDGSMQITTVPSAYNGDYYISIFPKNGVPVTTSAPVSFAGSIIDYDFTTDQTKAYGSFAMKEVETGVFALYSGELDHDMFYFIDLSDLPFEEADVELGSIGYLNTDIDGNGWVDLSDLSFIEANMVNGPYFQNPLLKKRPVKNQ
jgi:hypothetical protein